MEKLIHGLLAFVAGYATVTEPELHLSEVSYLDFDLLYAYITSIGLGIDEAQLLYHDRNMVRTYQVLASTSRNGQRLQVQRSYKVHTYSYDFLINFGSRQRVFLKLF